MAKKSKGAFAAMSAVVSAGSKVLNTVNARQVIPESAPSVESGKTKTLNPIGMKQLISSGAVVSTERNGKSIPSMSSGGTSPSMSSGESSAVDPVYERIAGTMADQLLGALNKGLSDDNPALKNAFLLELYQQLGQEQQVEVQPMSAGRKPYNMNAYSKLPLRELGGPNADIPVADMVENLMNDKTDLTIDNYKQMAAAMANKVNEYFPGGNNKISSLIKENMREAIAKELELPDLKTEQPDIQHEDKPEFWPTPDPITGVLPPTEPMTEPITESPVPPTMFVPEPITGFVPPDPAPMPVMPEPMPEPEPTPYDPDFPVNRDPGFSRGPDSKNTDPNLPTRRDPGFAHGPDSKKTLFDRDESKADKISKQLLKAESLLPSSGDESASVDLSK